MATVYKCGSCGVVSREKGHLCESEPLEGKYDYCGQDFEPVVSMCETMREGLRFECETCGRPAERPDLVCRPTKVHG